MLGKKVNLYRKVVLILILIGLFMLAINLYKEIISIKKEKNERVQSLAKNLRHKLDFLTTTFYDFKSIKNLDEYGESQKENHYNNLKIFSEIRRKNNLYGKMGYSISLTKKNSDRVITAKGTKDKKILYESLGLYNDNLKNVITDDGDNINIFFNDKNSLQETGLVWIISLDKKVFFSELNIPRNNEWYIQKNNKVYSLLTNKNKKSDKIILSKKKFFNDNKKDNIIISDGFLRDIYIFKDNMFKFNYIHIDSKVQIFDILIIESFKIFLLMTLLFYLIVFIIELLEKPVRELAKKIGYDKIIEEKKDKGEFEFIEEKINELNKKTLSKDIKDYLLGITLNCDIDKLEKNLELAVEDEKRVVFLEIFDIESLETNYEMFNLSKKYITTLKNINFYFEMVEIDYKSFALICKNIEIFELEGELENILASVEEKFKIKYSVGVSDSSKDLFELPKMYRRAKRLLDYKFIYKSSSIMFQEKISQNKLNNYYYPIELESKLISKTLSGNIIGIKKIINEIFEEKLEDAEFNKHKIKEFSALLYNTLNRIIILLQEFHDKKKIQSIELEKLNKSTDLLLLRENFLSLLLDICKITKNENQNDSDIVKVKIQTYLEENYMKDISLENLADYLGHSFKYTSILFKKLIGDNFKSYLSQYRIEKAKNIMKNNSDYKIKDIAEMVGCNSSNTFIRMFRRYEGTSPGKYTEMEEEL